MDEQRTRASRPPPRLGVAVVRGRSMLPTLRDGDRLLMLHGGAPAPGRLVVVLLPDGVLAVKRTVRREPGGWWVARDNPAEGVDSRHVGVIPDRRVLGRVLLRLWPPWPPWFRSEGAVSRRSGPSGAG